LSEIPTTTARIARYSTGDRNASGSLRRTYTRAAASTPITTTRPASGPFTIGAHRPNTAIAMSSPNSTTQGRTASRKSVMTTYTATAAAPRTPIM